MTLTSSKQKKKEFINKSFEFLLKHIELPIKFAYGNPQNKGEGIVGTNIKIFFIDKDAFFQKRRDSIEPTGILISFFVEKENNRKTIPIGGINTSTEDLIKEYGNMRVKNIYVTGSD